MWATVAQLRMGGGCVGGRMGWGCSEDDRSDGGELAVATICSQTMGRILHFRNVSMVRHLVRHPVAIYGSRIFKLFMFIKSKKHIKDEFQQNCLKKFWRKTKSFLIKYFFNFLCLMIFWVMGHLASVSMLLPHMGMRVRTLTEHTGFAAYRHRRCTVGAKIPIRFWAKSYLKIWQIILTAYFITKPRVHTFLLMGSCAWRDNVVHQRMNANGLLPYDLFS